MSRCEHGTSEGRCRYKGDWLMSNGSRFCGPHARFTAETRVSRIVGGPTLTLDAAGRADARLAMFERERRERL